jgi:serine protease AprX
MSVSLASWRWQHAVTNAALVVLAVATLVVGAMASGAGTNGSAVSVSGSPSSSAGTLAQLAATQPAKRVEVIVQLQRGTDSAVGRNLIHGAGGRVTRDLRIINGFGAEMTAAAAAGLQDNPSVHAVSLDAKVEKTGVVNPDALTTSFNASMRSDKAWGAGYTGKGVGVAVIDTGIAGDLPDFQVSDTDTTSRVIANAVVNPSASTPGDGFGHGTHIAGLIAGNSTNRPAGDPLRGKYAGVAPEANLINVKAGDEDGNVDVIDVIDGLQFVVDHKDDYNIRVANLSLSSTVAESYKTDPLDAAVEQAWLSGIVVVTAAGNRGGDADAVSYAPANDPYVISVGAVDDAGTKQLEDDKLTSWSSRGRTQDGFTKPEVVAPGAHLVSTMAPNADFLTLCPTCVVDGVYFRVGGTSMAAGLISGEAAVMIQKHPDWTPDQVKGTLVKRTRPVKETVIDMVLGTLVDADGSMVPLTYTVETTIKNGEASLDKALAPSTPDSSNGGLVPNNLIIPSTGKIDFSRASWSRASWSEAADALRASWSRASWSRASWSRASWSATPLNCADLERASWSRASWSSEDIASAQAACTAMDPTRASWSRASWSRASWSTSFTK